VAGDLSAWGSNVLGSLEKRIKELRKELELCRRGVLSGEQVAREGVLRYRLDKAEEQKDLYWKQRAHVKWMTYGDRNTAFFHASCMERRRKNKIGSLKKESGGWVEKEVEKRNFITNHFSQLFRSSGNQNSERLLDCVENKVTNEMNAALLQDFARDEVYAALKSIDNLKAPGPDGMPALFYKEYWDIVGDEVVTEVLKVLDGSPMPDKWNDTTVVLIPKVRKPEYIKDLRPISLCNVIYKLISKVLANRLKKYYLRWCRNPKVRLCRVG
jgi:hypothetical protein